MRKEIYYILFCVICTLGFASCSESDDSTNEYENWQARNDEYFQKLYDATKSKIAAGDSAKWKIIKSVYKNDSVSSDIHDYIIVEVLQNGDSSKIAYGSPLQTDSIRVFYEGRLIPSTSYSDGKVFDCSWTGDYNLKTMVPSSFAVTGLVDGFVTAVQYMHIGDRWRVYMPYELGYDESGSGTTIPGYSNLIFDITLHSFARKGTSFPKFK